MLLDRGHSWRPINTARGCLSAEWEGGRGREGGGREGGGREREGGGRGREGGGREGEGEGGREGGRGRMRDR